MIDFARPNPGSRSFDSPAADCWSFRISGSFNPASPKPPMRSQSLQSKIAITQRFQERWLPLLAQGHIRPIIDTSFALAEAAAAHKYMEDNRNVGKIMLMV